MTAETLFHALFSGGITVMIVALVLGLGMGFTLSQVLEPLRRIGVIIPTIVVNAVLVPAATWLTCSLFALSTEERIALVLLAAASAGPAGLKSCEFAKRADMALAVSLVIVLQLVNIIAAPLWATAVVNGATVSTWMIIKDLLLLVVLPLAIGLVVRARYPEHASEWKPSLEKISNIALIISIVAGLAVYWDDVVQTLGSRVIVASIVIVIVVAALGWAGGFRHTETAVTSSMITAMRFTPIGLVVIMTQLGGNGAYLAPALVFALVATFVPFAIALEAGRLLSHGASAARPAGDGRATGTSSPAEPKSGKRDVDVGKTTTPS
jgi:BASS family bile acid:Na+ symporter